MDPASAIGIAAAAVQFFDVGIKAIRLCRQIRSSAVGATQGNEELEATVRELCDIRKDLQAGDPGRKVVKTQEECLEISEKLLTLLESIKAPRKAVGSHALESLSATWRAMRSKGKIEKLEAKVEAAQRQFKEALTVDMRNGIERIFQKQGKDTQILAKLCEGLQRLGPQLQQIRQESASAHTKTHVEIDELGMNMTTRFEYAKMTALHREILESLEFSDMLAREQHIKPPEAGTFEWVFTGESPYEAQQKPEEFLKGDRELRGRLLQWLKNDESTFWVNGKAGSGKSSLMSFASNDERAVDALRSWSGGQVVHIIRFFFWRPGSLFQRSIPGLLRSLLWQLLRMDPTKIDDLLADGSLRRNSHWPQVELLQALKRTISVHEKGHICFFIDGLDEHDGDYMDLVDILLQSAPNIKTCLSSRPESAFVHRLQRFPSIRMQNLNQMDIELLVRQKLTPCGTKLTSCIEDVTRRAEGIFLWAALTCASLISGYTAHDDEAMLMRRLNETPSGLRELFNHMFSKIDDTHRKPLMLYCHLLKWASEKLILNPKLTLVTASLHSQDIESLDEFLRLCEIVQSQIPAQSKGLVEIVTNYSRHPSGIASAWSLRDHLDHKLPPTSADWAVTQKMLALEQVGIQWVHRTAHDCIFGEAGEEIAAWLISADSKDLCRSTVSGSLWLAQWAPTTTLRHVSGDPASRTAPVVIESRIFALTIGITSLCGQFEEESCHALDEIHDLSISASTDLNRKIIRNALRTYQVENNSYCPYELRPLGHFWHAIFSEPQHQYYASRFDRLERHPFATSICADIILTSGPRNFITPLFARLFSFLYLTLERQSEAVSPPRQISHERQWRISTHTYSTELVISWMGRGEPNEMPIMTSFSHFLESPGRTLQEEGHDRIEFLQEIGNILESRHTWIGQLSNHGGSFEPRLSFMTPARDFAKSVASDIDRTQDVSGDSATSVLQLVCLHHRTRLDHGIQVLGQMAHSTPKVVVSFEISNTLVKALFAKNNTVYLWKERLNKPWLGTLAAADLERFVQAILEELWADVRHQLDAWQQLYALACVKAHVRWLRRIGDSDSQLSQDSASRGSEIGESGANAGSDDDLTEET
jgi:hypothetical protein